MKQHPNRKRVLRRIAAVRRRGFYKQRAKTFIDLSINPDPKLAEKIQKFIDSIR